LPRSMVEVHPSWQADVEAAYLALAPEYRAFLEEGDYIPPKSRVFQAFKTLPKTDTRYILFGQDPYPRPESAQGYAFIDGAVEKIFCEKGLCKAVNRATSLRNFIKTLLVCEGLLELSDTSQTAIAKLDKKGLIDSIGALRQNFERNGVLLLNTALIFEQKGASAKHVRAWRPFVRTLLARLDERVELILFGGMADTILKLPEAARFTSHRLEHPYNHTFIANPKAHALFGPMHLIKA